MAAAHTPAPWHLGTGGGIEIFAADDGQVMSMKRPSVELIANAMLICAAPELLEASKALLAVLTKRVAEAPGSVVAARERLATAIKKAEGLHRG